MSALWKTILTISAPILGGSVLVGTGLSEPYTPWLLTLGCAFCLLGIVSLSLCFVIYAIYIQSE